MATGFTNWLLRKGMGLLIIPCLWLAVGANSAAAQAVWSLDTTTTPATAHLDLAQLTVMSPGDTFDLQVDAEQVYTIRLDDHFTHTNGDRAWYGSTVDTGLDYALVVTAGQDTAHLILTSPSGIFQLFGRLDGFGATYSGPFNRLEQVRDPVSVADTLTIPGSAAGSDVITTSGLSIDQRVSRQAAPVGSPLTFTLDFTNRGNTGLTGQYVDIFFVLENTTSQELPDACEVIESTDMQPVLRCDLGDIAAGQAKHLSFSVATGEDSYPLVYSTAVVGDIRSDVIVELYRDVLTDSDGDGITDFNETLAGLDPHNGLDAGNERDVTIDVLVAYTPDLDDIYLGEVDTRINQLFNVANKIFADSDTGIRLRPVGVHAVDYTPKADLADDLSVLTYHSEDDAFADLDRQRSLYGGDLVVLFRSGEENGLCGLANLGGRDTRGDLSAGYQKSFAYSVINLDCMDDSVLAHEIGHNLGLVHSRIEDPDGGTLPSSAGYGVDTRFVTVMAFPDDFNVVNRLYRFSDPERSCGPYACGADAGAADSADAVATLKLVKHQVAGYYRSQEQRMPALKAVSTRSGAVPAVLGVAAYNADSSDFGNTYSAGDRINLRMKIRPLPKHVGRDFVAHVVIASGKGRYLQLTNTGKLVPWDGSAGSLRAATNTRSLHDNELFDVLENLDFREHELSGTLNVYVAYKITGELVYSGVPYTLHVGD